MVADIVTAGLSTSLAIEAVRLLSRIAENMHIVADNGTDVLCAFVANAELHDALCVWGASAELDEDDGTAEDDFRANPKSEEPEAAEVAEAAAAVIRRVSCLVSPRMAGRDDEARQLGGYAYACG